MNIRLKVFWGIVIATFVIIIAWAIYSWPIKVETTLDGITYRGGDFEYAENMTLVLDGHYYRHLFKGNEYIGKIYVEEMDLKDSLNRYDIVRISFTVQNWGALYYNNIKDTSGPGIEFIGNVMMQPKEPKVVITIHEEIEPGHHTWNSGDGIVFAAPAINRPEAVNLTNELFEGIEIKPIE